MIRMRDQGYTYRQIADQYGLSHSTVETRIAKFQERGGLVGKKLGMSRTSKWRRKKKKEKKKLGSSTT